MKKLMKKKVNVLGKTFSIFAILMVASMGLASAALVGYLSNTVTGSATVDSPFKLEMSLDDNAWSIAAVTMEDTLYGSDSFVLYTKLTNQADKILSADYVKIIVSNNIENSPVECAEFTVEGTGCTANDDGTVTLLTGAISLEGGDDQIIPFTITSAANIEPATYTFSAEIPSDLA